MRNVTILTVGFALAMLGGSPPLAWGTEFLTTNDTSFPCGDAEPDGIDISRVDVESDSTSEFVIVTLFMCAKPIDESKYVVYFDVNVTSVGVGDFVDPDFCEEDDRLFDAAGKVRFRIRKTVTKFKATGPAMLTDGPGLFETPFFISEFTITYDDLGKNSGDGLFIWVATQSKIKGDKGKDFLPDVGTGDKCIQPANFSEVIFVNLD